MTSGELILVAGFGLILFATKWLQLSVRFPDGGRREMMLWIAQGFGSGRVPVAPGTVGSVIGVVWFALLMGTGRVWALILGTAVGLAISVWLCDDAERMLVEKDPGSVIIDEISAMPVCFFGWVGLVIWKTGSAPNVGEFFSGRNFLFTLGIFAAFRFFDVVKPWPIRQSQALSGGWGVTIDDLLAAVYVNC